MKDIRTTKDLDSLYQSDKNVMQFLRETGDKADENEINSILLSYDLQSGSYTQSYLENEKYDNYHIQGKKAEMTTAELTKLIGSEIAKIIDRLNIDSLLEVGVGEATTLCDVLTALPNNLKTFGIDLSPSRIAYANKFLKIKGCSDVLLSTGDMFSLPFSDNQFDAILTVHAIEPNTNREREALQELLRVTKKYLILIEPSFELGNSETKERIMEHKYIKNLFGEAKSIPQVKAILKHELFKYGTFNNQSSLLIIEKANDIDTMSDTEINYACPICKTNLLSINNHLFCPECYLVFPILKEVPMLRKDDGILFSKFCD